MQWRIAEVAPGSQGPRAAERFRRHRPGPGRRHVEVLQGHARSLRRPKPRGGSSASTIPPGSRAGRHRLRRDLHRHEPRRHARRLHLGLPPQDLRRGESRRARQADPRSQVRRRRQRVDQRQAGLSGQRRGREPALQRPGHRRHRERGLRAVRPRRPAGVARRRHERDRGPGAQRLPQRQLRLLHRRAPDRASGPRNAPSTGAVVAPQISRKAPASTRSTPPGRATRSRRSTATSPSRPRPSRRDGPIASAAG